MLTSFVLGAAAPAHAVFWFDEDPMRPRVMEPSPPPVRALQQRDNRLKQQGATFEKEAKAHAKPVGPLVIAISLDKQTMRVFDANGLFAETRVSTGMRGHATPTGVFSIIQKNKWHKSNIYSGAPMPYMQRITWSGIALHAGALPGYPASHGCIRMPMAFSTKLWSWTRMGARVIITPGEISPAEFSHPQLIAQKPVPVAATPMAAPKDDQPATAKPADGKSNEGKSTEMKPDDLGLKPSTTSAGTKTVTADASNALPKPVLTDAGAALAQMSSASADIAKLAEKKTDEPTRVTRQDVDAAAAKIAETPAPEVKQAAEDLPPASPLVAAAPEAKKDDSRPADAPKAEQTKTEVKAETETKPDTAKRDAVDIPPPPDTSPKRTGQIAVLISGKDGKLYVRQNFAPLFETPITIKPGDRPLGTHVFTARIDKDEAKSIHWTAVSLPAVPQRAAAETGTRKRAAVAPVTPESLRTDSAAEALDRVTIPEDAMAQIAEALATGGSIIVSDQSIKSGGETGQGTEFVVPMR
ncbi:L,D-transpeptidase [Tardiphaga alba]|uniref:L,D-transpeptidase n=1 Tax=Tardiphaga alba TaxID=340268 RepID=UPI002011F8CB|nr:L,D-transpeptidase [Tardiphaga alba]